MIAPDARGLIDYFRVRREEEAARVDAVWSAMTRREQRLVREIAVMASVRTMRRCGSREQPPPDNAVVADAILACLYMCDLYPTVSRLERNAFRRRADS